MTILPDQSICIGKDGTLNENGDHIYNGNQSFDDMSYISFYVS